MYTDKMTLVCDGVDFGQITPKWVTEDICLVSVRKTLPNEVVSRALQQSFALENERFCLLIMPSLVRARAHDNLWRVHVVPLFTEDTVI